MNNHNLTPLEYLFDLEYGIDLPLPTELANLYGHLSYPERKDLPFIIGNFVTTLDGVVALNVSGQNGGGDISGFNEQDPMIMGLLLEKYLHLSILYGANLSASNVEGVTCSCVMRSNQLDKSQAPYRVRDICS